METGKKLRCPKCRGTSLWLRGWSDKAHKNRRYECYNCRTVFTPGARRYSRRNKDGTVKKEKVVLETIV